VLVFSVWAGLALSWRRLHDLNAPGGLAVFVFFPAVGR
jgi:uncharacterized membrane protein YhaH (DUF805 family)